MGKASKSSRKASKAQKAKDEQNPEQEMAAAAAAEREECFLCQQPSDGKRCSDCGIAQAGHQTFNSIREIQESKNGYNNWKM